MRRSLMRLVLALAGLFAGVCAVAEPLRVVSSIKPLQLLVTAIGDGAVRSERLLPPGFSPHDARLKPSQWQQLDNADLLVWVGPGMERFLQKAMSGRDNVVTLGADLPHRHDHADDPHFWLNIEHVAVAVERLRATLAARRPSEAARFAANSERLLTDLRALDQALRQAFATRKPRYVLPHDGYRPFESQYGLRAAAVLSAGPEQLPGTAHVLALRERLQAGEFDCVFREPQHASRLQERLLEGIDVPVVALDPMGMGVTDDAEGFVAYYRSIAEAFLQCREKSMAAM